MLRPSAAPHSHHPSQAAAQRGHPAVLKVAMGSGRVDVRMKHPVVVGLTANNLGVADNGPCLAVQCACGWEW